MDLEIWEEQRQFKNKGEIETNKQHLGPLCANMLLWNAFSTNIIFYDSLFCVKVHKNAAKYIICNDEYLRVYIVHVNLLWGT